MARAFAMFYTGLAIAISGLVALMLAYTGINGLLVVFTNNRTPLADGLGGLFTFLVASGIMTVVMLALLGLAALLGIWLPIKLVRRLQSKPIPERIIHRLNPDA